MNHLYDVAVIGAGPAGSYTALLVAMHGHRVVVLEQRCSNSIAPRCTGIVGLPYVELVGVDRDVILAQARSATFLSPSGARMRVSLPAVQAYVLDRALLEQRLRHRAAAAGAEICEGIVVSRVTRVGQMIEVAGLHNGRTVQYSCRALILAAGVSPGLSRQAGIAPPGRYMVGAHAEVEMDGVDETEVHMLPDLAPGAFAWLVPVGGRLVRVGVLCSYSAGVVARRFLERPGVRDRVVQLPAAVAQRPVPVSVSRRMYAAGVLVIGDAAGQVKPTTGGGLYFGAVAANAAADVVSGALERGDLSARALSEYERRWKTSLGRELRHGVVARSIYQRLSPPQVDRIISHAARTGLAEKMLSSRSFSFDRHGATLLLGLLRCVPGLIGGGSLMSEEARR